MTRLSTELEEQKTQLQEHLSELQQALQHRKDKDNLQIGNALKKISRKIDEWETEARDAADPDEATRHELLSRARDLRAELVRLRSG